MTSPDPPSSDTELLMSLAHSATHDAGELLRAEFALAKDELKQDLRKAGVAAAGLVAGALLLEVALGLLALGVVLALGGSATAAFLLSLVYASVGVAAGLYAAYHLPEPLSVSKRRVERDVREIVEASK